MPCHRESFAFARMLLRRRCFPSRLNTIYCSSHLHLTSSDARGATFLTSIFASRVVSERGTTVDTQLQALRENGTCRYNKGNEWVLVCVTFSLIPTSVLHGRGHIDVDPLYGRIEETKSFRRMENTVKARTNDISTERATGH